MGVCFLRPNSLRHREEVAATLRQNCKIKDPGDAKGARRSSSWGDCTPEGRCLVSNLSFSAGRQIKQWQRHSLGNQTPGFVFKHYHILGSYPIFLHHDFLLWK
jgi:hypothetical protein